ncbi:MAG TPA: hypothetical protein VHH36_05970 [Candidatus Thermoplasmatota archaeon]|nr:hypothetical protein [Candidatus Thermoplasmatota archaeon]
MHAKRSVFALVIVASSLAALTPFAAAHYYQGPNPPPCPNDGQIHEHRWTDGRLHCRSIPTSLCRGSTSGLFVNDPLAGPTFVGPVLVSVTANRADAQFEEPQVEARNTDGLPGVGTGPIVQQESTRVEGEQVTRTWRVFAGPDVRAYEVDFRVNLRFNGLANCLTQLVFPQRN